MFMEDIHRKPCEYETPVVKLPLDRLAIWTQCPTDRGACQNALQKAAGLGVCEGKIPPQKRKSGGFPRCWFHPYLVCSSRTLGKMNPIMGWFNHQPVSVFFCPQNFDFHMDTQPEQASTPHI